MTFPTIDTFSFAIGVFSMALLNLCEAFIRGFMRGLRKEKLPDIKCSTCRDIGSIYSEGFGHWQICPACNGSSLLKGHE